MENNIMIRINEVEEIIRLIHKGYDIELLSFELDIPINELQEYKKRLEFRQSVKKSIKKGKVVEAIDRLNSFIENTDDNIIERAMLLKLKAYSSRTMTDEKELKKIEEERKKLGFYRKIDDILEELKVQIPQRKSSKKKSAAAGIACGREGGKGEPKSGPFGALKRKSPPPFPPRSGAWK